MSTNSQSQQRPEPSATHTSTVPPPQHPLHSSTADSAPPASSQLLHQTFQPQYPHPHPTLNPQYPPSHPPSNYPPPQPYTLVQPSHPLQQAVQYPTHHTASHPPSHYQPPLQIRQADHSLYQLPRPQSFPHPLHYPATGLHSIFNYSPQYSTPYPPSHPPLDPTHIPFPHYPAHQSQYVQSHPPSYHTHYQPTLPPTHYTPPQPPTPYYPPHYLPPIQPPQAAVSTSSVSEETVPPAKIARLEPPVRPHSSLSQYQHIITDVGTTDSTPLVSQLRATQTTACPTPPNPLLTDDSSVSRQPSPPHTSATPPLQSSTHYQSSRSDQPQTTAVQSESLTFHQSRIVEDVLTRYTSRLTEAFSNDLQYFSNRFIELGFVRRKAVSDILSMVGIGSGGKGDKLLDLVIANCNTSRDKKVWFDKFVGVFSCEAAYEDLATSMTEYFSRNCKDSSSSTAYAAHPSLDHSFQSHSPTTDRPSLPAEVGRSQVMSHSQPQSVHTQSHASSHSLSAHVQRFIYYLKTFYKGYVVERNPKVVKLLKMPTKVYINLACINRKSVRDATEYEKVTKAMVCDGNVDVIRKQKWPIDFNKIAANLPTTSLEKVILVEGAPGVGKSTYAWEFCRRWERGEIAQQYQLVLLLRLREERISNAKSLEDLIYHSSKDVRQAVIKELEDNLGVNTLIILEGFDELPDICRTASSVFLELIHGQLLPLATVMVTSRPWATRVLHEECSHRIFQHIEILGFTDQQISLYIKSVLCESDARDFENFLESHPQIRAGMYIPLNSAIVVTVYEESQASGYAMPTTLTELYTSLSQILLLRYMRGHPEYENASKSLRAFNDLPPPVYAKFCELCKLAYSGTVGNTTSSVGTRNHPLRYMPQGLTYDSTSDSSQHSHLSSDFGDLTRHQVRLIFRDLPSDFNDLGFMDSVTELYVTRGAVSSHNFLHLTFQEFFAAVHISSMSPAQQVEHFKRHKEGRLKVVLRFLAGLNKLNCFSIEEIENNFFLTSTCEGSRYQMSCDAAVGIDLVQWLFEAQSDDEIEHVLGQKTIEFKMSSGMLPLDYYSLGYCISHSQCQWVLGLEEEEEEKEKEVEALEVRMLVAGAGTRRGASCRVVGLNGGWDEDMERYFTFSLSTNCLNMLFTEWKSILFLRQLSLELPAECGQITWPDLSALRELKLGIGGKTELKLNNLLPHLSLESLTIAGSSFFGGDLVCEDCVAIGDHVKSTTSLKELCILDKECIPDVKGVEAITAALASNQSLPLERLELKCECTSTATAGDSLAQFITNTTTLQYLSMRWCTFSAHALLVLARAIHHNSILQTKNVENYNLTVNGDNDAKGLAQLLVEYPNMVYSSMNTGVLDLDNSTLTVLDLSNNSISDAGAVALAQALHHNSTLTWLNLSKNGISDAGAEALAQALHHNSTLTRLYLSNNSISDGAVALAQALHHNSTLTVLDLSNNSISDAGAVALAQALHHNSTLTVLDLSNNSISDAGAVALAQALHHNSTLTMLDLYGNDGIGEEGTRQLVQALTVKTSINKYVRLRLPRRCEEYATQCPQYHSVKNRILFL